MIRDKDFGLILYCPRCKERRTLAHFMHGPCMVVEPTTVHQADGRSVVVGWHCHGCDETFDRSDAAMDHVCSVDLGEHLAAKALRESAGIGINESTLVLHDGTIVRVSDVKFTISRA